MASKISLRKHPVTRAAHYLFLLPFLPGLRPLLVSFRPVDLAVYLAGIALVLALVIYGNHRPLVEIEANHLSLYLNYRHNAEYHPFREISAYKVSGSTRMTLYSAGHRPVNLQLKKDDLQVLVERLQKENIDAKK